MDTCYSATHMSQTRDQQRFTISEVAADWYEPMVLADTPSPQSATLGLHPIAVATTHFPPAERRRLSWPDHTVG